jgi:hypothetical protein
MRSSITSAIFFLAITSLHAQSKEYTGLPSLIWPKLYNIQFEKSSGKTDEFQKPIFSQDAKSLAGKKISLPGYIVPFSSGAKSKYFMLSSLPLNACFFCGVGGPESVIEVYLSKEISYTEKPVEVQGILRLNDKDPDKMIYILEQAELGGEVDF